MRTAETTTGYTAATWATRNGHVAALQLLLHAAPQLAGHVDGEGMNCAFHAVQAGRLASLQHLLAVYPESGSATAEGYALQGVTPAHIAACGGKAAILELLLAAAPATATAQAQFGSSPA